MYRRLFCLLAALFLLNAFFAPAKAEFLPDYVRLHVVAADDDERAQDIKLHVRDACLRCARALLADCESAEAAYDTLRANRRTFELAARVAAREMGCEARVTTQVGTFDFPARIYGDLLVPAGEYRALRVVIGEGEGHNWWCVLYPSLCVLDEYVYASGNQEIEIRFYSAVARWLQGLFCG